MLDRHATGGVGSVKGKYRLFGQRDDGFASVESSRTRYGAFFGSGEPYRDPILGQTPLDWHDRRIIPGHRLLAPRSCNTFRIEADNSMEED